MYRPAWFLRLFALTVTLAACATNVAKSGLTPVSDSHDEDTLVGLGDSSHPQYSRNGLTLLFVSGKRPSHAQPQVYELDLATLEERRLTYQTGTTYSPKYHPKEPWIVYASTTDELKENPPLLNPSSEVSPLPPQLQTPSEIYIHSLNGLEITRVTDHLGFDGEPQFSPDGKQLYWTRVVKNKTQVVAMNRLAHATQVVNGLGVNPAFYVMSADKKSQAWIDWDAKFEIARLMFRTNKEKDYEINADHQVMKTDLAFSPDSQYLAWSQYNAIGQHYEIWVYGLQNRCARMLVGSDSSDRRNPVFSPDMKVLTYSLVRDERSRIVSLPFVPPTGPCPSVE